MFEQLFRYPGVIERYHAGPHAEDRLRYLVHLAGTGARTQTLQLAASRQLALGQLLDVRDDQRVLREQLDAAIERWAQPRPRRRGPASPAAVAAFRGTVTHWLHFVGRLAIAESPPRPFASCVAEFADWMRERGLAEATIRGRCCVAAEFLDWFHAWNRPLGSLTIADVDRAVAAKSEQGRCGRIALHGYLKSLRALFRFAEAQGWCAPGLAEAVAPPRLYAGETVPAGLAWDDVQRLLASTEGARPADRSDRAALLLLAVYGLRAGEVCGLRLDDVDWDAETLRVRRPKPGRTHLYPLSMSVGEALLGYLRESRPQRAERAIFLTLQAPIRPLSATGLSCRVHRRLRRLGIDAPKRGAHALRHACAQHLLDSGLSMKAIGDHLGHRSPSSTAVYARVHLDALREVADFPLEGLA